MSNAAVFEVERERATMNYSPNVKMSEPHRPLILVVEDEAAIRNMLDFALRAHGFSVRLAASGAEAIDLYQKYHDQIAVVLSDIHMPEMDGPATLAALKKINPELKFCFMSGNPGQYATQDLLDMGAIEVLMKPFVDLGLLIRLLWDSSRALHR